MRELSLHVVAVRVRLQNLSPQLLSTRSHINEFVLLIGLSHGHQGLELVNTRIQLTILFLQHVRLLVEQVHIGLQAAVLLIGLNKSCNDFLNVKFGAARLLSDLLEGILNDARVSHVLVE